MIIQKVAQELTNIRTRFFNINASTQRVLWFYSMIFRSPPVVVLRVPERLQGQPYADVPAAVRGLADEYGLRVIVDGSPNSIPPETMTTNREINIFIEPMDRSVIESIPEFSELICFLKTHYLDDLVWVTSKIYDY